MVEIGEPLREDVQDDLRFNLSAGFLMNNEDLKHFTHIQSRQDVERARVDYIQKKLQARF